MRSGASYSVRGGSLRVRKVVATNSQGKKTVKKICQFQFDCPMVFQELLTVCNFKSGSIHESGDSPGSEVLPDKSLSSVPVEVGGGVTDTRKVDTSCVYNQADRYYVSTIGEAF